MKKKLLVSIIIFIFSTLINGQTESSLLKSWLDSFSGITGSDNTGLTVLPILKISPGGKRSSMADAFTAYADDISFFQSNPAVSAILPFTKLAFFHRDLISDVSMDSVFFTQRQKNLGYGLNINFLHFEFTALDSWGDQIASATPSELLFIANIAYNFFANSIFTGIAAGVNVKLAHRNIPPHLYSHVLDPNINSQNLVGIIFDFGLISRFNFLKTYSSREKNFSIGLSGINIGPPINNSTLPSEFRFGIAYRVFSFLTVTSDINYQLNIVDVSKSEGIGFSTGFDLHLIDFFSVQSGIKLGGNTARFSVGSSIILKPVTFQISYTLDLGTSFSSLDNFSIGAIINIGDGGRLELQKKIDQIYASILIAYSHNDFKRVIELCDKILDSKNGLDPGFTPAREARNLAVESLELEQKLKKLNSTGNIISN